MGQHTINFVDFARCSHSGTSMEHKSAQQTLKCAIQEFRKPRGWLDHMTLLAYAAMTDTELWLLSSIEVRL